LGRAGDQPIIDAGGQLADVDEVETIDILGWVEGPDDPVTIYVTGKGQLHEDTVNGIVGIEPLNQVFKLALIGIGGQSMSE
jgi:hypothetical protein